MADALTSQRLEWAAPPGWRMAGIIRQRQVLRDDILLVLGGGAGAEHLAELYRDEGKPVVPVHTELGAYCQDGNGGSRFLHGRVIADPDGFFRLRDGVGSAAARISGIRLRADTDTDTDTMARQAAKLLTDLRPRPAFYVRLLDASHPDHAAVEQFFRDVVDDVVVERGFTPHEMGCGSPQAAFINVEIFEALHRAGLVKFAARLEPVAAAVPDAQSSQTCAISRARPPALPAAQITTAGRRAVFDT